MWRCKVVSESRISGPCNVSTCQHVSITRLALSPCLVLSRSHHPSPPPFCAFVALRLSLASNRTFSDCPARRPSRSLYRPTQAAAPSGSRCPQPLVSQTRFGNPIAGLERTRMLSTLSLRSYFFLLLLAHPSFCTVLVLHVSCLL